MYALLLQEQGRFEKIAVNSLYCILALAVFSGQGLFFNNSIFAYENNISHTIHMGDSLRAEKLPPPDKEINFLAEKNHWETSIKERYKNASIAHIENGIIHVKLTKYINSQPVRVNIVEVNRKLNPNIELAPALASNSLARKATIRTIAQKNNSIAAINGTYFKPQTGVPLGTLMINGKLLTGPIYNRVAMGIGEKDFKMARVEFNGNLKSRNNSLKIDNINQPRMLSSYTLVYTKDWGQYSPPTPKYGIQIAIENNKITQISNGSIQIPQNGYVLSGPKEKLEPFFNEKSVEVNINTMPGWQDVKHIISGGPYLIKDNQLYVDTAAQKLNSVGGKNPRTAIGYTKDDNLIMVTIDGREERSVGMNLYDLAKLMKSLGCINAMNLDGGGSSVMYVKGNIVNNPAVRGGIAISNAFTISVHENSQISYNGKNQ